MAASPEPVPADWFVGFHRGLAARFWRLVGAAILDSDWATLGPLLEGYDRVLDAPCGDGRLGARAASAGHSVVGVDISAEEIDHARSVHPDLEFEVGDLRALPSGPFDAVFSWGNSFGYLTPEDTARSLGEMARVLRPGGRLVLDTGSVAEAFLVGGLEDTSEHDFGGIRATVRHRYDVMSSRIESEYTFLDESSGETETTRAAQHVHTTGELVRMLYAAGFEEIALLSADGVTPFAPGEGRLTVLAQAAARAAS